MSYEAIEPFVAIDTEVFRDWKWNFFKYYKILKSDYTEKGVTILFIKFGIRITEEL